MGMPESRHEGRLRAALDSLPDLVAVLDHDWTFQYVNESASLRLGMTVDELIGHSALRLLPEVQGTRFAEERGAARSRPRGAPPQ